MHSNNASRCYRSATSHARGTVMIFNAEESLRES